MPNPAPFLVSDAPATLERTTVYLDVFGKTVALPAYVDAAGPTAPRFLVPYLPAASVDKLARALDADTHGDDVVTRDGGTVTVTESAYPDEPTTIAAQATARGVIVWPLSVGWSFTTTR